MEVKPNLIGLIPGCEFQCGYVSFTLLSPSSIKAEKKLHENPCINVTFLSDRVINMQENLMKGISAQSRKLIFLKIGTPQTLVKQLNNMNLFFTKILNRRSLTC